MTRSPFKTKQPSTRRGRAADGGAHFEDADRYRDLADWPKAAESYAAGLSEDPSNFAMWVQYGHALKESGRLEDAGDAYRKARDLDDSNHDLQVQLGHLHKIMGDPSAANECYRRAVKMGSLDQHALMSLGGPINGDSLRLILAMQPNPSVHRAVREAWLASRSFAEIMLATVAPSSEPAAQHE